jgi:hypothetical protein
LNNPIWRVDAAVDNLILGVADPSSFTALTLMLFASDKPWIPIEKRIIFIR